jgi:MoaA/NifB/PqqE/SkfB family radical SAM enzyme
VFCYQTDPYFTQGRSGHMGQMPLATFRRIVDEIEGNVEAVTLASRGEPLLCKQIMEMLAYIRGKFLGLKINTNGWYLDERKAHAILEAEPNTLVFSADAADPELYAQLRVNGKLERVLDNVRRFAEIRTRHYPNSRTITRISGVQYSKQQDFGAIEGFWHDYVDQVAFVDYNPWENAYETPANGLARPCSDLWRRAFIWWDGRMNPCDVDYKSTLSPGTVDKTSVSELWRGEGYQRLRRSHTDGQRQALSPCRACVLV